MKIWISRYALSEGIKEGTARRGNPPFAYIGFHQFMLGRDAHETREAALKAAEAMRVKKIASLRKQIEKLEAMKFE